MLKVGQPTRTKHRIATDEPYTMRRELLDSWTRDAIVRRVVDDLRKRMKEHPFDAIAFIGISGAVLAPIVAYELGVGLIAVQKKGTRACSRRHWHGPMDVRYIILDDDVNTGATLRWVLRAIGDASTCVGAYFYDDGCLGQFYSACEVEMARKLKRHLVKQTNREGRYNRWLAECAAYSPEELPSSRLSPEKPATEKAVRNPKTTPVAGVAPTRAKCGTPRKCRRKRQQALGIPNTYAAQKAAPG